MKRSRSDRLVAAVLVASVCVVTVEPARAAPKKVAAPEDDEANRLKKEGDQAMGELRYEDALARYTASYALRANPALHYNRGRALEALGRYAEALDAYARFEQEAPADLRAKVPSLTTHLESLRQRVAELTLNVNVAGARVVVRNVVVGDSPLAPLRLTAGKARLEITADGYEPFTREVDLVGGKSLTLEVSLVLKTKASRGNNNAEV